MILHLIATFAIGLGAGGIVVLLNRMSGRRLPKALMPICAGAAMFAFQIWEEYTWFDRTAAALPENLIVAETYLYRNPIQVWTMLKPRVATFDAVDQATAERHQAEPSIVRVQIQRHERFTDTQLRWFIFDCATPRATPHNSDLFDARGLPPEDAWVRLAPDDQEIWAAACGA